MLSLCGLSGHAYAHFCAVGLKNWHIKTCACQSVGLKRSVRHQGFTSATADFPQWGQRRGEAPYSLSNDIILPSNTGTLSVAISKRAHRGNSFCFLRYAEECHTWEQNWHGRIRVWSLSCAWKKNVTWWVLFVFSAREKLRCNTHNPRLKGYRVSTRQGLVGLFQLLLPSHSHH